MTLRPLHFLILTLSLMIVADARAATEERPQLEFRQLLKKAITGADSFDDQYDAQVWLVDMSHRLRHKLPDAEERLELLRLVHYEARRARLSPELVLSVIDVESNFDHYALSYAGARGLMQIMPFWLDEIGRPDDNLFDVDTNLRFGCTILRHYLDVEKNNLSKALARYNGSVGKLWYADRVLDRLRDRWYQR